MDFVMRGGRFAAEGAEDVAETSNVIIGDSIIDVLNMNLVGTHILLFPLHVVDIVGVINFGTPDLRPLRDLLVSVVLMLGGVHFVLGHRFGHGLRHFL